MASVHRVCAWLIVFLSACGSSLQAEAPAAEGGQLVIRGKVLLADGSPADKATVTLPSFGNVAATAKTNSQGEFQLKDALVWSRLLYVSSADNRQQITLPLTAATARTQLTEPLTIRLAPARRFEILVTSADKAVKTAQVAVFGKEQSFEVFGLTNEAGIAEVWIPADEQIENITAWHPELGVAGRRERFYRERYELKLHPPKPHTVRVIDAESKEPVKDLMGGFSFGMNTERGEYVHANTPKFSAADLATDSRGEVVIPWAPAEHLTQVGLYARNAQWRTVKNDTDHVKEGISTIHVRREALTDRLQPIKGQLELPPGESAGGILVRAKEGGIARTDSEGRFELMLLRGKKCELQLNDTRWAAVAQEDAADKDPAAPSFFKLKCAPAVPVLIRVKRNDKISPIARVLVSLRPEKSNVIGDLLYTNEQGEIQIGVLPGKYEVALLSTESYWIDEGRKTIEVQAGQSETVDIVRDYSPARKVQGTLVVNGRPFAPSNRLDAQVAAIQGSQALAVVPPEIRRDGSLLCQLEHPTTALLMIDLPQQVAGFIRLKPTDDDFTIAMEPLGSIRGQAVDEKGQPIPRAYVTAGALNFQLTTAEGVQADEDGRFRLRHVAANVPMYLNASIPFSNDLHSVYYRCVLEPGEARENVRLKVSKLVPQSGPPVAAVPKFTIPQRLERVTADVRMQKMHTLIILLGDDAKETSAFVSNLEDTQSGRDVLGYLLMLVTAKTLEKESAAVKEREWRVPGKGEVVLIARDGNGKELGTLPLKVDTEDAVQSAQAFVTQHRPPITDAAERYAAAQEEAKRTDKHIFFVAGGPRCGPCFKLGQWLEKNKDLMAKDFVVTKVSWGWDKNGYETIKAVGFPPTAGIPWTVILDAEGQALATSDGPLGNIGFPSELESIRHLGQMLKKSAKRLTADEIVQLLKSLEVVTE